MNTDPNQFSTREIQGRSLILFLIVVLGCTVLGSILNFGVLYISGNDLGDFPDGVSTGASLKVSLFIMTLFTFLVPALLFAWMQHKQRFANFLGLRVAPKWTWIAVAVIMLTLMMPIIQFSFELNQGLPLPDWMRNMEASANDTLEQLLQMDHLGDLLINLLLIAVLPALGEELFFRGIIQQYGYALFSKAQISIWVSAFIFSAIHLQFEGFIPRFLLGLFLGYLFYWSRSLWLPIFAHFLNNAFMLIFAYSLPSDQLALDEAALPDMPLFGVLFSMLLLVPAVIYMRRISNPEHEH